MAEVKVPVPFVEESPKPKKFFGVRHLQVALLVFTLLIFYGQRTCLSVAIIAMTEETPPNPDVSTYPEWDDTDTILSSFFWGYIIPQVAAGQLGEYFGPIWFLFVTMILSSISSLLIPTMAAVLGSTGVMFCRIFQGLNQAFLFPSITNLNSRWIPKCERSTASGFIAVGTAAGIVTSMLITGVISDSQMGWPAAFYLYGGVGIAWALIFALLAADSPSKHRGISEEERVYIESRTSVTQKEKKIPTPWKSIATSLPVWANFISCCSQLWVAFTLLTEIPSYMSSMMNFDIKSNSELSALPYAAQIIMNLIQAPIPDKLISKKIFKISTTRKIFNGIGTMVPAAALFGLGFVNNTQKELATTLLVVAVASTTFCSSGSSVNIIDLAPNHAGTLFAICYGISNICSILGPLTVEFLGDDKTDPALWRKVFWLASLISFGGGLFYTVFSTAELQPWNEEEEKDEENTPDKENK